MNTYEIRRRMGLTPAVVFGTTIIAWTLIALVLMPHGLISQPQWFVLPIGGMCALLGGIIGGRASARAPLATGLTSGAWLALLNLIILLSMLGGDQPGDVVTDSIISIAVACAGLVVLMTIGACIGYATRSGDFDGTINWRNRFVWIACLGVIVLLAIGGIVTGLEAGLAIEGWLTADGYPLLLLPLEVIHGDPGKFAEHSHRLFGVLIGFATLTAGIVLWRTEDRASVRALAVVAMIALLLQATLGGTRVTEANTALAIFHGVLGQLFFAVMVALAVMTTSTWRNGNSPEQTPTAKTDRRLTSVLLILLFLQIVLGTVFRHQISQEGMPRGALMGILHGHSFLGSAAVFIVGLLVAFRSFGLYKAHVLLKRSGYLLIIVLCLQMTLGMASFIVVPKEFRPTTQSPGLAEVLLTSAHQATGAILLATAGSLWLLVRRCVIPMSGTYKT